VSALAQRLNRPIVAIVAVTAIAAFPRFTHLSSPPGFVFDEVYYPKAGCILIGWSDDVCHVDSDDEKYWREHKWDVGSWVHPPLGKWEIGLGIKAFGMNEFGWRFTSALAGTLVVTMTAGMAQLLFRRPLWTFLAGLLIALEHLNVVMSRTALLDVHLEFWVVVGFLCVLLDRRWIDRRSPPANDLDPAYGGPATDPPLVGDEQPVPPTERAVTYSPVWRPWRFASGAAFGASASVKWSGAMALFAAAAICFIWEISRRHRGETTWRGAFGRALLREGFGLALAFVVTPIAVYMLVWVPWFHHFGWSWHDWWDNQAATWRYHSSGLQWTAIDPKTGSATPTHPYYSRPWTWILMLRPVSFYVVDDGPNIAQVLGMGSPALFWGNLLALAYLPFAWRRLRDWRAGFLLLAFGLSYAPWFAVSRPTFFFYVLPLTPIMALCVTYLLIQLADARIVVRDRVTGAIATHPDTGEPAVSTYRLYLPFVIAYVVAVVLLFVWAWPVLTAGKITDTHWRAIVWFTSWI